MAINKSVLKSFHDALWSVYSIFRVGTGTWSREVEACVWVRAYECAGEEAQIAQKLIYKSLVIDDTNKRNEIHDPSEELCAYDFLFH